LKQLYVAVTRPRNRLIIYDEVLGKREKLQKMWKQLDLVDMITSDDIQRALNESTGDASLQFKQVAT
jgi:ATP-dependent exoDNAse (exonuclease V) beta subunit